jgi:hypothetical protein
MMSHKADKLVTAYVAMRDDLSAQEKTFKEFKAGRKADMLKIADALQKIMDADGIESLKTTAGTAFRATKDFVGVDNWAEVLAFVKETDTFELFNKAVNKAVVKEYMGDHEGMTPPGVNYGTKIEIQIRRPK